MRTLYKAYGLRFIFTVRVWSGGDGGRLSECALPLPQVSGTAGKFSFVPLLIAFGSGQSWKGMQMAPIFSILPHIGLGLLGLATVIADLLVTKCLKNATFYYGHKYEIIDDDGKRRVGGGGI